MKILRKLTLILNVLFVVFLLSLLLNFKNPSFQTQAITSSWYTNPWQGETIRISESQMINPNYKPTFGTWEDFSVINNNPSLISSSTIYMINTPIDLLNFSLRCRENPIFLTLNYYLGNDIDYSQLAQNNALFIPVGFNIPFTGSFDGRGYEIKNIQLDNIDYNKYNELYNSNIVYYGMFSQVGVGGEIKNVGLLDPWIFQTSIINDMLYTGLLVGNNLGLVERCFLIDLKSDAGYYSTTTMVASLIARNGPSGVINDCYIAQAKPLVNNITSFGPIVGTIGLAVNNLGSITNFRYDSTLFTDNDSLKLIGVSGLTTTQFDNTSNFPYPWKIYSGAPATNLRSTDAWRSYPRQNRLFYNNTSYTISGYLYNNTAYNVAGTTYNAVFHYLLFTPEDVKRYSEFIVSSNFSTSTYGYALASDIDMSYIKYVTPQGVISTPCFGALATNTIVVQNGVSLISFQKQLANRNSSLSGGSGGTNYFGIINLKVHQGFVSGTTYSVGFMPYSSSGTSLVSMNGGLCNINFYNFEIIVDEKFGDLSAYNMVLVGIIPRTLSNVDNVQAGVNIRVLNDTIRGKIIIGGIIGYAGPHSSSAYGCNLNRVSMSGVIDGGLHTFHPNMVITTTYNVASSVGGIVGGWEQYNYNTSGVSTTQYTNGHIRNAINKASLIAVSYKDAPTTSTTSVRDDSVTHVGGIMGMGAGNLQLCVNKGEIFTQYFSGLTLSNGTIIDNGLLPGVVRFVYAGGLWGRKTTAYVNEYLCYNEGTIYYFIPKMVDNLYERYYRIAGVGIDETSSSYNHNNLNTYNGAIGIGGSRWGMTNNGKFQAVCANYGSFSAGQYGDSTINTDDERLRLDIEIAGCIISGGYPKTSRYNYGLFNLANIDIDMSIVRVAAALLITNYARITKESTSIDQIWTCDFGDYIFMYNFLYIIGSRNSGNINAYTTSKLTWPSYKISGGCIGFGIRAESVRNDGDISVIITKGSAYPLVLPNDTNSWLVSRNGLSNITYFYGMNGYHLTSDILTNDSVRYTRLTYQAEISITGVNETQVAHSSFVDNAVNSPARFLYNGGKITVTDDLGVNEQLNYNVHVSGVIQRSSFGPINMNYATIQATNRYYSAATNYNTASIDQCVNRGEIFVDMHTYGNVNVAGIVGFGSGQITNCYNLANIMVANEIQTRSNERDYYNGIATSVNSFGWNFGINVAGIVAASYYSTMSATNMASVTMGSGAQRLFITNSANHGTIMAYSPSIPSLSTYTIEQGVNAAGIVGNLAYNANGDYMVNGYLKGLYAFVGYNTNYSNIYARYPRSYFSLNDSNYIACTAGGIYGRGMSTIIGNVNYGSVYSSHVAGGVLGTLDYTTITASNPAINIHSIINNDIGAFATNINYGRAGEVTLMSIDGFTNKLIPNTINSDATTVFGNGKVFGALIGNMYTGRNNSDSCWDYSNGFTTISSGTFNTNNYTAKESLIGYPITACLNLNPLENFIGHVPYINQSTNTTAATDFVLEIIKNNSATTNSSDNSAFPFNFVPKKDLTDGINGVFNLDFAYRNVALNKLIHYDNLISRMSCYQAIGSIPTYLKNVIDTAFSTSSYAGMYLICNSSYFSGVYASNARFNPNRLDLSGMDIFSVSYIVGTNQAVDTFILSSSQVWRTQVDINGKSINDKINEMSQTSLNPSIFNKDEIMLNINAITLQIPGGVNNTTPQTISASKIDNKNKIITFELPDLGVYGYGDESANPSIDIIVTGENKADLDANRHPMNFNQYVEINSARSFRILDLAAYNNQLSYNKVIANMWDTYTLNTSNVDVTNYVDVGRYTYNGTNYIEGTHYDLSGRYLPTFQYEYNSGVYKDRYMKINTQTQVGTNQLVDLYCYIGYGTTGWYVSNVGTIGTPGTLPYAQVTKNVPGVGSRIVYEYAGSNNLPSYIRLDTATNLSTFYFDDKNKNPAYAKAYNIGSVTLESTLGVNWSLTRKPTLLRSYAPSYDKYDPDNEAMYPGYLLDNNNNKITINAGTAYAYEETIAQHAGKLRVFTANTEKIYSIIIRRTTPEVLKKVNYFLPEWMDSTNITNPSSTYLALDCAPNITVNDANTVNYIELFKGGITNPTANWPEIYYTANSINGLGRFAINYKINMNRNLAQGVTWQFFDVQVDANGDPVRNSVTNHVEVGAKLESNPTTGKTPSSLTIANQIIAPQPFIVSYTYNTVGYTTSGVWNPIHSSYSDDAVVAASFMTTAAANKEYYLIRGIFWNGQIVEFVIKKELNDDKYIESMDILADRTTNSHNWVTITEAQKVARYFNGTNNLGNTYLLPYGMYNQPGLISGNANYLKAVDFSNLYSIHNSLVNSGGMMVGSNGWPNGLALPSYLWGIKLSPLAKLLDIDWRVYQYPNTPNNYKKITVCIRYYMISQKDMSDPNIDINYIKSLSPNAQKNYYFEHWINMYGPDIAFGHNLFSYTTDNIAQSIGSFRDPVLVNADRLNSRTYKFTYFSGYNQTNATYADYIYEKDASMYTVELNTADYANTFYPNIPIEGVDYTITLDFNTSQSSQLSGFTFYLSESAPLGNYVLEVKYNSNPVPNTQMWLDFGSLVNNIPLAGTPIETAANNNTNYDILDYSLFFEVIHINKMPNEDARLSNINFVSDIIAPELGIIGSIHEILPSEYQDYLDGNIIADITVHPMMGINYYSTNSNKYYIVGQIAKTNISAYLPTIYPYVPNYATLYRIGSDGTKYIANPLNDLSNLYDDFTPENDTNFKWIHYRVEAENIYMDPNNYIDYYISIQDVTNNVYLNVVVKKANANVISNYDETSVYVKILGNDYETWHDMGQNPPYITYNEIAGFYYYSELNDCDMLDSLRRGLYFQNLIASAYLIIVDVPIGYDYSISFIGGFAGINVDENNPHLVFVTGSIIPRRYTLLITIYETDGWGQNTTIEDNTNE